MALDRRSAFVGAASTAGLAFLLAIAVLGIRSCGSSTSSKATPPSTPTLVAPGSAVVPTTPSTKPATFPSTNSLVTLDGQARSVETTAALSGLATIHVGNTALLTAIGEVPGHGRGTLTAEGADLALTGDDISVAGRARIQPGTVTLNTGGNQSSLVSIGRTATVTAPQITFQPAATTNTSTTAAPITLTGPVQFSSASVGLAGADLQWLDAPTSVHAVTSEGDLSWAGTGSIATSGGPLSAPFLGVRAQALEATLVRGASSVDVHGSGHALQAYANGVPQFRTPARIDVLGTRATTGFLGRRHAFVWTPRNLGTTYDMAILSIHPGNTAAGQVHIGLQPMPPMFGGEPHALVGGDTSGLKSGSAIDSLVARNGDDKRSVGYDPTNDSQIVLIVQGNFDTITVTIPTY